VVGEHDVPDERQVDRGGLGGDVVVHGGDSTGTVGAGPDPVHGHGAELADLELFLAQGLDLDGVLPPQGPADPCRLDGRVVAVGGAVVQAEGTTGDRDVHLHPIRVDAGRLGGCGAGVLRGLAGGP